MRALLILQVFLIPFSSNLFSQTWSTINKADNYLIAPYHQFVINPYTNDIWLNSEDQAAVIESDGTIVVFDNNELGSLWIGCNLTFTFTQDGVYFAGENIGLNSFFNYNKQLVFNNSFFGDRYRPISSNQDTIYMPFMPPGFDLNYSFKKYTSSSTTNTNHFFTKIVAKNDQLYGVYVSNYSLYKIVGDNNGQIVDISNDPQNINSNFHDLVFQRNTDTLYIAGPNGINLVYEYDYFDTITPNNTSGMLSPNVLEIEFDHEDKLWAIFGDINDNPIGLAKLDGTNWIDYTTNCPLDFGYFLGMEIDSYGNVWLADGDAIHTLLGPNSPGWLNLNENESTFNVYPNPVQDELSIQTDSFDFARIIDMHGKEIETYKSSVISTSNLDAGVYMLHVYSLDGKMTAQRIVKQ